MEKELTTLLWAKSQPFKSLMEHMRETAIVCRILMAETMYTSACAQVREYLRINLEETQNLVVYLAGLHDIGKCHPLFQMKNSECDICSYISQNEYLGYPFEGTEYRHEIGSSDAARRIWKKEKMFDADLIRSFSAILKLHHQGKNGKSYTLEDEYWEGGHEWMDQQDYLESIVRGKGIPSSLRVDNITQLDAACTIMTAIIIVSDWVASNSYFEQYNADNTDEEIEQAVRNFFELSGMKHQPCMQFKTFPDLWKNIPADSMRPLQRELDHYLQNRSELPLLLILEAPMGEGKTEAGLYAAFRMAQYWNREGIYVALPTAATSNQMFGRVNNLLEQHQMKDSRLMHSMSWLKNDIDCVSVKDDSYMDIQNWTRPSKLSMLSPNAVGTVDQALMAVLKTKYGVLRLFGLAGKVLFIDEVHAYDAYMSSILKKLLEWCRVLKIPVVLLSATLPAWKKQEMLEIYAEDTCCDPTYQQITAVYEGGRTDRIAISECVQNKTIQIRKCIVSDNEGQQIIDILQNRISKQGCACVIVNTIDKAQRVYKLVKEAFSGTEVILFHSAFTVARRAEIEHYCLDVFGKDKKKRPEKCILIATQVVEQSLDLDFDIMISEIAPIDLLLQRAGRLHRHAETVRPDNLKQPELWILVPPVNNYGSTGLIYYNHLLDRTKEVLNTVQAIKIPEDIPGLVDYVYQRRDFSEEETERFMQQLFSEQHLDTAARSIELGSPMEDDFGLAGNRMELLDDEEESWASAKTRIGEDSVRFAILPQNLFEEAESCQSEGKRVSLKLAKTIMEYSVSVSKRRFREWTAGVSEGDALKGDGKLKGMILLNSRRENYLPTDTIRLSLDDREICLDCHIGLTYTKKGV